MTELTIEELREEARRLREAARKELNLEVKRQLALRALKLAERAEDLERKARDGT